MVGASEWVARPPAAGQGAGHSPARARPTLRSWSLRVVERRGLKRPSIGGTRAW
jgi:hypothetical protein